MRVAVVHEWLMTYAGSEKVLRAILESFPGADLFCVVDRLPRPDRSWLDGVEIHSTFLQRLPGASRYYRALLPLMPYAIEQFDLSGYDLIISNSHAVAKGVITGPDQLHICYCYTPPRYAWDLQHQYLRESGLSTGLPGFAARCVLHNFRKWDLQAAFRVDHYAACSDYISRRIQKVYRRSAKTIYPGIVLPEYFPLRERSNYFITYSRLVPYKRIPLIVEAFNQMPQHNLVVIGDGPEMGRIRRMAKANIQLLGFQPDAVLAEYTSRARAFVFAAEEDFGLAPLEAQSYGTPVLAYSKGGARETVLEGRTGLFFHEQSTNAIRDAVIRFERIESTFERAIVRAQAERFSIQAFKSAFAAFVDEKVAESRGARTPCGINPGLELA